MPEKCVVFGCSAMPSGGNVSLHHFPKDSHIKQAWIRFVQRTRKWAGPTETSTVCSQHFMPADFENLQKYKMGFAKSLKLKPAAVPIKYPIPPPTACSSSSGGSTAAPRSAARKRELQRLMHEMDEVAKPKRTVSCTSTSTETELETATEPEPPTADASTQTDDLVQLFSVSCQTSQHVSSKGIQVSPSTREFSQTCNRLPRKQHSASWCSTPKKERLDLSDICEELEDDEGKDPSYLPEDLDLSGSRDENCEDDDEVADFEALVR